MGRARISSLWGIALIVIVGCSLSAYGKYGGGSGEPNDPYLISDANHMNEIGLSINWDDWDKCFRLMADIDLSGFTGTSFNIIGIFSDKPFVGVFDGNGHTISNFTYDSTGTDQIGIFGFVSGEIKDLTLIDPNLDAGTGRRVGSLVGWLDDGTITNCCVAGGSVSGNRDIGGLTGANGGTISDCYLEGNVLGIAWVGGMVGYKGGTVSNCHSASMVSGTDEVGGLVAINDSTISNCSATGSVLGNNSIGGLVGGQSGYAKTSNSYSTGNIRGTSAVGGLIGASYGKIYDCYARGSVWGDDAVGGLVGTSTQGDISNCYAAASVGGDNDVGGLMGYSSTVSYTKCFWDSDVNPDLNGIGNTTDPDVIGESTTNMHTESTFTGAGWDFTDIWSICEQTNYPRFLWQIPIGDFLCPDGVNFFDFSFFAGHWQEDNCGASNDCDGTDLDLLGKVEINDLRIFVDNWMKGF